jgi:hypothetical protein
VATIRIRDMSDPLPKLPPALDTAMGQYMAGLVFPDGESLTAAEAGALLGVEPSVVALLEWRGLNPRTTSTGGRWETWTVRRLGAILAREAAEPCEDRDWVPPAALWGRIGTTTPPDKMLAHWRRLGVRLRTNGEDPPWDRVEGVNAWDLVRLVGIDPGNGRSVHYGNVSRRIAAAVDAELSPAPAPPPGE